MSNVIMAIQISKRKHGKKGNVQNIENMER
jgi:hypothetical protein